MIIFLALALINFSFASEGKLPAFSLDAHLHVFFLNAQLTERHLQEYLRLSSAKAFLISPSYVIDSPGYEDQELPGIGELQNRKRWNDETAKIVRRYPDKFFGLCGIGWNWQDLSAVLKDCLKNPEMVGFKLRFEDAGKLGTDRLSNPSNFKRINQAIRENSRARIILIHPSIEDYYTLAREYAHEENGLSYEDIYKNDLEELDWIVNLAKSNADRTFIIAHMAHTTRMLAELSRKKNLTGPIDNLFVETSMAVHPATDDTFEKLYVSARAFGLDHVLFGSDAVIGREFENEMGQTEALASIYEKEFRKPWEMLKSPDEQVLVFEANGRRVIESLVLRR